MSRKKIAINFSNLLIKYKYMAYIMFNTNLFDHLCIFMMSYFSES